MILVTGASGKTGQAVVEALVVKKQSVRVLVRCQEQVAKAYEIGAVDVVVGDIADESVIRQAALGACALYHICPNVHADEIAIGEANIGAAIDAGVQHLVFHSVLHPQIEAMPHHWRKMRVEEALFESGLSFTILQPSTYMQNIIAKWDEIVDRGVLAAPYSVESQSSPVDLHDVATVAAIVLCDFGQHSGATYELCGPEVLTPSQQAMIISAQMGHVVCAEQTNLEEWILRARANGLGDYALDALCRMFRYYDRYGFWGNSNALHELLGRQPTSYAAFVKSVLRKKNMAARDVNQDDRTH